MADEAAGATGPLGLVGGLFQNLIDLMGDKAGSAVVRFAALQEGERIGSSYGADELAEALVRVDGIMGQHSRLDEDGPGRVVVHIQPEGDYPEGAAVHGVLLGLLEGLLKAVRGKRFTGSLEKGEEGLVAIMKVEDNG